MTDMMKYIISGGNDANDPEGHLEDISEWNEAKAEWLAKQDGLSLTPQHLEVIRYLRELHRRSGRAPSARALSQKMQQHFKAYGGRKWLYSLFPKGPVTQGCRLSGIPVPPNNIDPSFGTSL